MFERPILDDTSQALLLTAEIINNKGWSKGKLGNVVTGPMCIMGALAVAAETGQCPDAVDTVEVIENYLGQPIVYWNDRVADSKEQVVTMLKEVAYNWSLR